MKKFIYSAFALMTMGFCPAQTVSLTHAEYFWDTDPGEGNATAITATDGNFNSAFEKIAIYGLGAPGTGLHKFCVRVKDNQNAWGPVFTNVVRVEPTLAIVPLSLTEAEYFWDADPGEGNATGITAADGNFDAAIERITTSGITAPSAGLHRFSVRVKDNLGVWGPAFSNVVKVEQVIAPIPVSIAQAEYFWDTDPGEGNATPFAAADGNYNAAYEKMLQTAIPLTGPVGLHVFNVRIKDNTGVWGPVFKNAIYIETVILDVPGHEAADDYYFVPNPATSVVRFNKEIAQVDILDLNGRLIGTTLNSEVDIAGLATGTYILKVTTPEGLIFTKKMIKR